MAAAPHRRIVKSTLTVLTFWVLVGLAVAAWTNLPMMLSRIPEIPWRLSWIAIVLFSAAALALAVDTYHIFRVTMGLRPMAYRGAVTSIGILPSPILPARLTISRKQQVLRLQALLVTISPDKHDPRLNTAALLDLAASKTPMAELFWAVFSILDASQLPASPVRGSHGDALLISHSLRVSAAMAKLWETATAPVMPTDVNKPAQSRPYDLPTAILAGIAHDIGKVRCFKRGSDGTITVIGLHDMVGSRILASLPEFWGIVDDQGVHDDYIQRLLTQSIRYYHHPSAYPGSGYKRSLIHTDGAVTALMETIHDADLVAGAIEGRSSEIMADYRDEDELPELDLNQQIWETFLHLMDDESLINSKSPQKRIAYKKGRVLYIIENKLRTLICDHLSLTRADYTGNNNGNPGKLISVIAHRLDAQGLIKKDFQGRVCKKPEGAGFYLQIDGTNKDGESSETELRLPHYIVRITEEEDNPFAKYANMEDYPAIITPKAPTWPQWFSKSKEETTAADTEPLQAREPTAAPAQPTPAQPARAEDGEDEGAADDDDRDIPPDLHEAVPHDAPESAGEEEGDDDDPFDGPGVPPATSEETRGTPSDTPSAPVAESAGDTATVESAAENQTNMRSREEKLRQLQRVRDRASMNRESPHIIRREMETPKEKNQKLIERVRHYWTQYPGILTEIAGRDLHLDTAARKSVLFALIWMDQIRRDRAQMTGAGDPNAIQKVSLGELFSFPVEDSTGNLVLKALEKLGTGRVLIPEMRTLLEIRTLADGSIDLENGTLSAPVQLPHDQSAA